MIKKWWRNLPEEEPEEPEVYLDPTSIESLRLTLRLFREHGEKLATLRLPENHGKDASAMRRLGNADPHAHVSLSPSTLTDDDGTEHRYLNAQIFAVSGERQAAVVRYRMDRGVEEADFIGEVGHGMRAAIKVARRLTH